MYRILLVLVGRDKRVDRQKVHVSVLMEGLFMVHDSCSGREENVCISAYMYSRTAGWDTSKVPSAIQAAFIRELIVTRCLHKRIRIYLP